MSGFDILNAGNKKSFFSSLNKRKRLGYDDSDSSDDDNFSSKQLKHIHENPRKKTLTKQQPNKPTRTNISSVELIEQQPIQADVSKSHIALNTPQTEYSSNLEQPRQEPTTAIPATTEDSTLTLQPNGKQPLILLLDENEQKLEDTTDVGIDDLDPDLATYLKESNNKPIEPKKITIKLQFVVPESTTDSSITPIVEKLLKPMKVIVMNDEQFDKILTIFCDHKKLKKLEVVLTYKEDKVFVRGTPAGLGMEGPETHLMYIYPMHTWDEKLIKEEQLKSEIRSKLNQPEQSTEDGDILLEAENKMFIKLRGSDKKEISLRVKPTTLLSAVADMYKKITKIEGDIQLNFEGEPLDLGSIISETELESEDLLEVTVKK